MTAQQLITAALQDIGVAASGELPTPEESANAFSKLNAMLDAWNTERLNIFEISDDVYPLTTASSYTIGRSAGATFAADRPQKIENANIISADGTNYDLTIYDADKWAGIVYPNVVGMIPQALYCDYAYPNATLHLWQPPDGTQSLELFTWKQIGQLASLATPIFFPPGYQEAILWNLEVRLSPGFGKRIDPAILALAIESKANIQRINLPAITQIIDPAVTGDCQNSFINITTGGFR